MEMNQLRAHLVAWMGLLVGFLAGCVGQGDQQGKNVESQIIPIESIYSTNGQKKIHPVKKNYQESYGRDLIEMASDGKGMGPTNVFLVRGDDIADAVKATRRGFMGVPAS